MFEIRMLTEIAFGTIGAGLFAVDASAEPGGLDPSFDYNGIVKTNFSNTYFFPNVEGEPPGTSLVAEASWDSITTLAIQSDGKIIAGGSTSHERYLLRPTALITLENDRKDYALVRYLPNGSRDPSFGTDGRVVTNMGTIEDELAKVFILPDGKILAVGACLDQIGLVRYLSNGGLDLTFGKGGKIFVPLGGYRSNPSFPVVVQPDGKIVIGANIVEAYRGTTIVVRLNSDGTLDTTFGEQGKVPLASNSNIAFRQISALVQLPNGDLVAAGMGKGVAGTLIRLLPNGSLDSRFGTEGTATLDISTPIDMAVQNDGKFVIITVSSDRSAYSPEETNFCVARFNADGTSDTTFGINGKAETGFELRFDDNKAVIIQKDGRIVVVGNSYYYGKGEAIAIACYNPDGTPDETFGSNGKVLSQLTQAPLGETYLGLPFGSDASDSAGAMLCQADGKIVVGGTTQSLYSTTRTDFVLARYLIDNSASSLPFAPEINVEPLASDIVSSMPTGRSEAFTAHSRRRHGKSNRRPQTVEAEIRNLGTRYDSFMIRGPRGNRQIKLTYQQGDTDVTAAVTNGTYRTPLMSPEDILPLTVRLKPMKKMRRHFKRTFTLIAISNGNQVSTSAATIRIKAKNFKVHR